MSREFIFGTRRDPKVDPLRIESSPSWRACFWSLHFVRCAECEAVSNLYFNSRQDQRRTPNPHVQVGACGNLFVGCDITVGTPLAASKVHQKKMKHKRHEAWHKHLCPEQWIFLGVGALCLSAGHHLRLTRGPAGNRTTTGSLSATQECRDTNWATRTPSMSWTVEAIKPSQPKNGHQTNFPHCKWSFSRCTDSARLRQDSATKDIKTGTKTVVKPICCISSLPTEFCWSCEIESSPNVNKGFIRF